jgi:hypothetical protein
MRTPSLSKAAFQHVATLIGNIGKGQSDEDFARALRLAEDSMHQTNPMFNASTFRTWATDVREGRRSFTGEKV